MYGSGVLCHCGSRSTGRCLHLVHARHLILLRVIHRLLRGPPHSVSVVQVLEIHHIPSQMRGVLFDVLTADQFSLLRLRMGHRVLVAGDDDLEGQREAGLTLLVMILQIRSCFTHLMHC
jgi:hypothetical protein